ncbi:MAG TPA: hypothetical protein EYG26_02265 [Planctomycetes bacterium]|nr:hypothetical protein [Planctomycetota bacterium]
MIRSQDTDLIPRAGLALVLLGVVLLAATTRVTTRTVLEPGLGVERGESFGTFDPDGHYHMRRLERALGDGGAIAGRDPLLTQGELQGVEVDLKGAPIPWPGGFTRLLWLVAAPFAPAQAGPARDAFVEVFVGSSAVVFGALQALVAALAAALLVRGTGALGAAMVAGSVVALAPAALRYSFLGMGDHHALASGLIVLSLLLLDSLLRVTSDGVPVLRTVAAAGTLAVGISIWLPCSGLMGLAAPLFAFGCWRAGPSSQGAKDLARTALLYFVSVALFLLPMGLSSPWPWGRFLEPSLMHPLVAACLGLCFLSLAWSPRSPWVLRGVVALVVGALVIAGVPGEAQAGFQRALAWVSARDSFIGSISESRPPGAALLNWTGPGLVLAAWGLIFPWRREMLLWRFMFLGVLWAGCQQVRFIETLVPLMAVLGGVAFGSLDLVARRPRLWSLGAAMLLLGIHGWLPGGVPDWTRGSALSDRESTTLTSHRSIREACRWLRRQPDPGPERAVLAQWDLGHGIEWLARRRTLASNFGAYLGGDTFLAPWVALASTDDGELRESLSSQRVSHILVTSRWQRNQEPWIKNLGVDAIPAGALVSRLVEFREVPGFLRLVHQSPLELFDRVHAQDPDPLPGARIYEVVPGAILVARVDPGEVLQVALPLSLSDGQRLMHRARATAGADGEARIRLPYPSDGQVVGDVMGGELRWSCAGHSGVYTVSEDDIRKGRRVVLWSDS